MGAVNHYESFKKLQYDMSNTHQEDYQRHEKQIVPYIAKRRIIETKSYVYKKHEYIQPILIYKLSNFDSAITRKRINNTPEINKIIKLNGKTKSSNSVSQNKNRVKYIKVEPRLKHKDFFINNYEANITVYRCQINTNAAENCCCLCNSDTVFEVMKDLYECYKKKDCNNCKCILCCKSTVNKPGLELNLENALKEVAMKGFALPEGKTTSEKVLIDKIRYDLGLPQEPMTPDMRAKYTNAANAGKMIPLEGKSTKEKEKILQDLHKMDIPLPIGRTRSDKQLINKILGKSPQKFKSLSENIQDAKRSGLLNFEGKTPDEIKKALRELAKRGIPFPEPQNSIQKLLDDKVRTELGLPPEPKSSEMREKHKKAAEAGFLLPLEGKSPEEKLQILEGLDSLKIPLPKGRTASEKDLINKFKERRKLDSETASKLKEGKGPADECICDILAPKRRKPLAMGLVTPLKGKSEEEKDKILKDRALKGLPLPEGETASDVKLIKKVRADLGLPPEPETVSLRDAYAKAAEDGALIPLEGKSAKDKEKILRDLHSRGIPLPKGRTPSEKSLINKITKRTSALTFFKNKTPEQQEKFLRELALKGMPLPEGSTESDIKLLNKVRLDLGLPPEPKSPSLRIKYDKAAKMGLMQPLEGKSPKEQEKILRDMANLGIPLPKPRTTTEKILINTIKGEPRDSTSIRQLNLSVGERAPRKNQQILIELQGKTPEEKEKVLREIVLKGMPLPEGRTPSETKLIIRIRDDLGLPPEPKSLDMRINYEKAADEGLLLPLEGRSPKEKEIVIRGLIDRGIPLPQGRTPSEKSMIIKIQREKTTSDKIKKAKDAGLLTPLDGKSPSQQENLLRKRAMMGMTLPKGNTKSQNKLIEKVRVDLGLPPQPKDSVTRLKYEKAADMGLLQPLEGKTPKQKEKILRQLVDSKLPLPKGRTPSEKALIDKIQKEKPRSALALSEKMRGAKAAGLLTPLKGKTPAEREKILKDLARRGIPLPEGKTDSEKEILQKVRIDLGLPPEPKSPSIRERYNKAAENGILLPLEGKTPAEKEKILKQLADMGISLPKARTPSEKIIIAKIKGEPRTLTPSRKLSKTPKTGTSITTEKIKQAKAAGLLTPLYKKSPKEKEKILRQLAKIGLPLPEGKTSSEKALVMQINKHYGLTKEPSVMKLRKAKAAGFLTPLEGKTPQQKEKILRGRAAAGLPLPKGKSPSEKELIKNIKASTGYVTPSPSELLRKTEAAGLVSPLDGKSPSEREKYLKRIFAAGIPVTSHKTPSEIELKKNLKGKSQKQKDKMLKDYVKKGVILPEGSSLSEKELTDKILKDLGLPPAPQTPHMREKYKKAQAAGIITPLEGKTLPGKEKILRKLRQEGIPLPAGRTPSEKALIKRIKAEVPLPDPDRASEDISKILASKIKIAKEQGLQTPLAGKSPKERERIIRGLGKLGLPLPEGATNSENQLLTNIRRDVGLPPNPETVSMKKRHAKAAAAGALVPLEGLTPAEKEKVLRTQIKYGLPLPQGRTPSEKSLIYKIKEDIALSKVPLEKLQKAKAAGLLTPLKGKSQKEKEKNLRGRAAAGVPLPKGRTSSEKALLNKIRDEFHIPTSIATPPDDKLARKAKGKRLLQTLTGKTPAEKEQILQGLVEAGLPLPEGKTSTEKALIKKDEDENVIKTSGTCERACGCDKKKIKFKHSYVKIRVTSPDISALCPCPNECVPRMKGGVFLDSPAINVIIERALTAPQYNISKVETIENKNPNNTFSYVVEPVPLYFGVEYKNHKHLLESLYANPNMKSLSDDQFSSTGDFSITDNTKYYANKLQLSDSFNEVYKTDEDRDNYQMFDLLTYYTHSSTISTSADSFDSLILIKSETTISFTSFYEDSSSSVFSFAASTQSNLTSKSYIILNYDYELDNNTTVNTKISTNSVCGVGNGNVSSEITVQPTLIGNADNNLVNNSQMLDDVVHVTPMSSTNLPCVHETNCNNESKSVNKTNNNNEGKDKDINEIKHNNLSKVNVNGTKCNVREPVIIITNLNSEFDLKSMVRDLVSQKEFGDASSLFVVVPSDEEENETCCADLACTQCIKLSSNRELPKENQKATCWGCRTPLYDIENLKLRNGQHCLYEEMPTTIISSVDIKNNNYNYVEHTAPKVARNKICQITTPSKSEVVYSDNNGCQVVSTDTTQDRPCCCDSVPPIDCSTNVVTKVITPNDLKQVGRFAESHQRPSEPQPEQILPYPIGTETPEQIKHFKRLLERNVFPHKVNKILKNMKQPCHKTTYYTTEHTSKETYRSTSISTANESFLICHQQKIENCNPKRVGGGEAERKHACSKCYCKHHHPTNINAIEKKRTAKIELTKQENPKKTRSLCKNLCKLHRPPNSPVPNPDQLVSIGIQDSPGCVLCLSGLPCTYKHEECGQMYYYPKRILNPIPVNVYDHAHHHSNLNQIRSYPALGSGGLYTLKSSKHTPFTIDTGVGVDFKHAGTEICAPAFSNKQVQKNSTVLYEYRPHEISSRPLPKSTRRENETVQKDVTLMKPNITQTTSRAHFDNKPHVQHSWTIEDIIRYYAMFKPEVLETLMSLTTRKIQENIPSEQYNKPVRHVQVLSPIVTTETCSVPEVNRPTLNGNDQETHEAPRAPSSGQRSRQFVGFKFKKSAKSSGLIKKP